MSHVKLYCYCVCKYVMQKKRVRAEEVM